MPNARIIRQDQEAAAKRYATYANQVAGYNAEVDKVNAANQSASDLYNQQAAEYNAWMEQIKAGQSKGVAKTPDGKWALLGSHDGNYAWDVRDERGNPLDAGGMYNSLAEAPGAVGNLSPFAPQTAIWVKNPDGTATRYMPETVEVANPNYNPNDWFGGADQPQTITQTNWNPISGAIRIAEFNTQPPTPQGVTVPAPEEPKPWNPSIRDVRELQSPTADPAGAEMAASRGEAVKTGLMNQAAGNAFADPEDPNNLKDKGILARVLGGQL